MNDMTNRPAQDLPAGTVTFLFTDIEGSTQLLHKLDDKYITLLDDHHRLLREVFARWHGREVGTEGDAFFVSFPLATDAVAAVVEAQRTLAAHSWPGGAVVRVRMGLHTGEAWRGTGGYVGMAVHRAARIAHTGHGGQVLLSETTAALVRGDLPEGVRLLDLGLHQLKDMKYPEHIRQLVIKGLPSEFPALKSLGVLEAAEALDREPARLPSFLEQGGFETQRPVFVGREAELARLNGYLEAALEGRGRVVFLAGDAGSGKSSLMSVFTADYGDRGPDLLVGWGAGNAFSGRGDPYLPFRKALNALTGDVEAEWAAGSITTKQAQMLWEAMPAAVEALLEHGPDLLDALIPTAPLLARLETSFPAGHPLLKKLKEKVATVAPAWHLERTQLFEQVTWLLRRLSEYKAIVLVLDDLQWADRGSLDLLFHLGRGLAGTRILLIAAYRPDEVTADKEHPLQRLLDEFRRSYGDVWLDLNRPPGRAFIDAFIDNEANGLDEVFRETFFRRTGSHPLFVVELLRDMQERGDLFMDQTGIWRARPSLDWDALPARVEGAIEARIGRLDEALRDILGVAAVEGEAFTAQVVAHVQGIQERQLLRTLSRELESRHKLVREQEEVQTHWGTLSRYKFSHALFQDYLYKRLSSGERRLLHGDVASALEKLFEGEVEEIVLQLGHHFSEARDYNRALPYFIEAADRAARIHANDEAVAHYTRALELADKVTLVDAPSQAELHHRRGLACQKLGDFDCARSDLETAMAMAHEAGESRLAWRLLLDLGKLWASRDYQRTHNYFEQALELARRMDDALVLGRTLNWMGNWHANAENPVRAAEYQQEALEIFQDLGDRQGLAITLDLLGNANLLGGDLSASVGYYDLAITLFQEMDDRPRLVSSLMGRGTTVSISILLATAPPSDPPDALEDIKEALRIAREMHAPSEEAWASWSLGLLHTARGQFGAALEVASEGLRIATELGHREWTVGNRFALGVVYVELLAPNEARIHLEEALSQAQGLRSQYWINHVAGALAAVYFLLDDLIGAQRAIETAISSQTAMDTMGKRYCWARRAELALLHGDPALALEIVERLIASALGMAAGGVITFLWQLKGDALAAMGRVDEAIQLQFSCCKQHWQTGWRWMNDIYYGAGTPAWVDSIAK